MTFEYWYMFPVAILFSTIAMASGIGGAVFFSPFFIIVLGFPAAVAIGTGLITELFGFASGLIAFSRKKLIDFNLGIHLLMATVPAALLGSWLAGHIDSTILKVILGMGLIAVALSFLRAPGDKEIQKTDLDIEKECGGDKGTTCLITAEGEHISYSACNRTEGRLMAGIGGLFVGLISTGLGELNGYFLMRRCRVPSKVSVATSVFVVAGTILAGASGHLVRFFQSGGETLSTVIQITVFTAPGVILGAQLGSLLASRIPHHTLERSLAVLFILIALLTLGEVVL